MFFIVVKGVSECAKEKTGPTLDTPFKLYKSSKTMKNYLDFTETTKT